MMPEAAPPPLDDRPASPIQLLRVRRFLPLFVTQFLGAANDNVLKNALVMLVTYRIGAAAGADPGILVTAAAGIFILPFFLFSATAGQLADRHDKAAMIRVVKLFEVGIAVLAAAGFGLGNAWFLLAVLFLMGTHSAFFGPLKYAILPQHLPAGELMAGNALVEAGTFLAILLGTIAGGLLILAEGGAVTVSGLVVGLALLGWLASRAIPAAPPSVPGLTVDWHLARATWAIMRATAGRRDVFLAVLGISWFWLVGATFLAQVPAFAKDSLGGDQTVVALFLVVFSVGIGLGSMLCNRLLRGEVSARHVPAAALGITLFAVDLYFAGTRADAAAVGNALVGAGDFLAVPANLRVLGDLLGVAVCGGLFIVPLYALMQARTEMGERARVVAGNNVLNALFMVLSALAALLLLAAGVSVPGLFLTVGVANLAVAIQALRLLPEANLKALLRGLLRLAYRVETVGFDRYAACGERVVIVANHVSFLDAALLAVFLPVRPVFAIDPLVASRWWVRPFLSLVDAVPVETGSPLSLRSLIKLAQEGRPVMIFPEGRITVTGALMKIYDGPAMLADRAGAMVLPIHLDGPERSPFSRMQGKLRRRWFPPVRLTMLAPRRLPVPEGSAGRARRAAAGRALSDTMTEAAFTAARVDLTLFQAVLEAGRREGMRAPALEDIERRPLSFGRLLTAALVLGRRLAALAGPGEPVGLLLPTVNVSVVAILGLHAFGRVPAMLNYATGIPAMQAACTAARLGTIVTSRRFVSAARLEAAVAALAGAGLAVTYLEDLRQNIGFMARLRGMLERPFAARLHRAAGVRPDDPAVILFTSGSEGMPKGVVLSHRNILANCRQIASAVDFTPADRILNALPVFHAFGLTGALLLPLIYGVPVFLYPSPLHYRLVPEVAYDRCATIMFGTDTFLAGYARKGDPYDFFSLRHVFAGAEPLRHTTRQAWIDKFGKRILEGYGATETAPVLALNTPLQCRPGTVGRFVPGLRWRLDPVEGLAVGGRLAVAGPNVMLGYLKTDQPGVLRPPPDGWYDTGDIVAIDGDGFVTVLGRAKRFAKVAGEMVSLAAAERLAAELWPDERHAVVAIPDPRKGEQLVLVTERAAATREVLLARARSLGVGELVVPRTVLPVERLPLLGTGKADIRAVEALVATRLGGGAA